MALSRLSSRTFIRQYSSGIGHVNIDEAAKTGSMWKKMFIFVALPCCILANINTYLKEKEEHEHWERPPFVPYSCMRIRTKRYPWGDGTRTLFHNPHYNALPTGWED